MQQTTFHKYIKFLKLFINLHTTTRVICPLCRMQLKLMSVSNRENSLRMLVPSYRSALDRPCAVISMLFLSGCRSIGLKTSDVTHALFLCGLHYFLLFVNLLKTWLWIAEAKKFMDIFSYMKNIRQFWVNWLEIKTIWLEIYQNTSIQ